MRLLAEAASDLNSSLELEQVFQSIARRVYRLVESHLFCIMLWNEEAEVLEHSYSLKFGEPIPQEGAFPLGHGISGTAALVHALEASGVAVSRPRARSLLQAVRRECRLRTNSSEAGHSPVEPAS